MFCEHKRRSKYSDESRILRRGKYSNERSGASVETARENGERRETRRGASHAPRACEARAVHTRGSRLRRFAPSENERKRLFCSLLGVLNRFSFDLT